MEFMRRFLATLLLLLLPIQFAFASAAGYCGLEKVEAPPHFGHHDHPDAVPVPDPQDDGDSGKVEKECGVCHLGCSQIQAPVSPIAAMPITRFAPPLGDDRNPDHPQEPSERPPRISLA